MEVAGIPSSRQHPVVSLRAGLTGCRRHPGDFSGLYARRQSGFDTRRFNINEKARHGASLFH
jgi:hypothetical protein